MKIFKNVIFFIILFFGFNVSASSGTLRQNSIISCNGKYYGNHGTPLHWHEAIKKDDKWVSIGGEVSIPSCYVKPINKKEKVSFSKCVDGDTAKFIINKKEETVRFLAINTPENSSDKVEPFGKESSEFTCQHIKKAKEIILEYDSNSDLKDKYGRILAFVYVDNMLLEEKLIEKGYAEVAYIYGDYEHVERLKELEDIARNKKVGIWSISDNHPDIKEEFDLNIETVIEWFFKIIVNLISKIFDL